MGNDLSNAFSILVIGMVTVFCILWLVVLIGNAIILIINRVDPNPESGVVKKSVENSPKQKTLAAIIAAVEVVTQGKGKIINIKHIK